LTLLGIYRILPAKGRIDYSTITAPGAVIPAWFWGQFSGFLTFFFSRLEVFYEEPLVGKGFEYLKPPEIYANTKSSADAGGKSGVSSFGSRIFAAMRWRSGDWGDSLYLYLQKIGQADMTNTFWSVLIETAIAPMTRDYDTAVSAGNASQRSGVHNKNCNGRLSVKVEAAGKHRIFAMVDFWTQASLRPLHDLLCRILKTIPQDGTFDQVKPLRALLDRLPMTQRLYSYDLKSATDRLAVSIQELIMARLFDTEFSKLWSDLLVGRSYFCGTTELPTDPKWVKYAVGQPIGAYSSWAMLALTHHALVQFCWYSMGERSWFPDYAVLGDDVVIANDRVARRYRAICRTIGLGIGMAKSLVAVGRTCEFAKRFFFRGIEVSGLPMNLWGVAMSSAGVALALIQRVTLVVPQSFANVATALGAGYKASSSFGASWDKIPRRLAVLAVLFTHPTAGTSFSRSSWMEWLLQRGPTLPVAGLDLMSPFTPWATSLLNEVVLPMIERLEDVAQEIFWSQPIDLAARLLDSRVNAGIVKLRDSFDKMEAALKHLQFLDIKFMTHQSSAVFQQVIAVIDRINGLPVPSKQAGYLKMKDEFVPSMQFFRTWTKLRERVGLPRSTSRPGGKGRS